MEKVCKNCGKTFKTRRGDQKFCSYRCFLEYKIKNDPDWKDKNIDTIYDMWKTRWGWTRS